MNQQVHAVLHGGYLNRRKGKILLLSVGQFRGDFSFLRLRRCGRGPRGLQGRDRDIEVEEHLSECGKLRSNAAKFDQETVRGQWSIYSSKKC